MSNFEQHENMARQYMQQGNLEAALFYLQRALTDQLSPYGDQASQYFQRGDWNSVLSYFRQNVDLRSLKVRNELRLLGQTLNNIGLVRHRLGDIEGAQRAYDLAVTVHCELLDPHHPEAAISLYNMGLFLQKRNDLKAAWNYLAQSLELWKHIITNKESAGYIHYMASCLAVLGELMVDRQEYRDARRNYEQALELRETTMPAGHPDIAQNVTDLGTVCILQGDLPSARTYLKRALALYTKAFGSKHDTVKWIQDTLRQVERNQTPNWVHTFNKNSIH